MSYQPYDWKTVHNYSESLLQYYTVIHVYLIKCRRYGQVYMDETGQSLHYRINSHAHDIVHRRTDESPRVEHFI